MTEPTIDRPLQGTGRRPDLSFLLAHPAHVLALGFGSGLSPVAPGTAGTLFAWLVFVALMPVGDAWRAAIVVAGLLVGWWACTSTARHLAQADPSAIVWDEIVAFWIVLVLVPPTWTAQSIAFVLFRVFDAAKPGPVAWADRLWKRRRGRPIGWGQGFGILFDDLVAAGCTLLVFAVAVFVTRVRG